MIDQDRNGIKHKMKAYITGLWNIFDILLFLLFTVGFVSRFIFVGDYFIIVQCLYAVSLSLFCLRMLQFYFTTRSIGPKVIMIREMIFELFFFLTLFALFIFSYGLLAHSLHEGSEKDLSSFLKNVIYQPYFQTYGELMLDEFPTSCNFTCVLRRGTVVGGFAIFLLLTNILLVNLLIAIFGYTINKIQLQSEQHYSFVHMQLVNEFYMKTVLPPPFNILCYIFYVLQNLFRKCQHFSMSNNVGRKENKYKNISEIDQDREKELNKLITFELICMEHATLDMTSYETWKMQDAQ